MTVTVLLTLILINQFVQMVLFLLFKAPDHLFMPKKMPTREEIEHQEVLDSASALKARLAEIQNGQFGVPLYSRNGNEVIVHRSGAERLRI